MIWNLPEELVHNVLCSWLGVDHFGRLDSAMCSTTLRVNFLRLFRASGFAFPWCFEAGVNDDFIAWLYKRDLAVLELTVTSWFARDRDSRVNYLKRHGNRIKSVHIDQCRVQTYSCGEALIEDFCEYCPNITTLTCYMTMSAKAHARIAKHWTQLAALRVRFQSGDDNNAESSACDAGGGLVAVCENCQALVELTVYDRVPASVVTAVLQVCSPNLQKIAISALLRAGDYEIIASRCSQLRELCVDPGTVDDAALLALAAGCPKLSYVPLCQSKVSDVGIIAVVARNRALTSLNLIYNCNVTDRGMEAVTANCPLLESIHLASCNQLTDATLIAIGQHCHNLRELNINDTFFTHVGLEAVIRGCPLLENLSASGGHKLSFAIVARCCPRLRCLAAANADVPTEAVQALAECCPLLKKVILSHNPQIGDEAITALARGCPNLTELGIMRTSVTVQGMSVIREHCKSLRHIFL
jgi:hypothetical protein